MKTNLQNFKRDEVLREGTLGLLKGFIGNQSRTKLLSDMVFDHVVTNIVTGELPPSAKISQRDLAQKLNVSQIPVREGMQKLQQEGWIESFPQQGTYVKNHTQQEIADLYQLREMYEGEAARIGCKIWTDDQLSELKKVVDSLQSLSQEENSATYVATDVHFHRLLVGLLGNTRMSQMYESILLQSRCFMLYGAVRVSFVCRQGMEEHLDFVSHKGVYEAIVQRDEKLSEQLVRDHIRRSCDLALMINKWSESPSRKTKCI